MKRTMLAALAALSLLSPASAGEVTVGMKMAAGSGGQPFCTEKEGLKELVLAVVLKDNAQLNAVIRDGTCTMLRRGTAIAILEDGISDDDAPVKVLRVRAMNGKVSAIGYTFDVGMVERK